MRKHKAKLDNKSGKGFSQSEPSVRPGLPARQGLYDPANEHDACGIGFVAHIKNVKSHDIVRDGLTILENLEHRGAVGADPKAGDGVGMLIQIPDAFFRKVLGDTITLPQEGAYGVGMIFLPPEPDARAQIEKMIETTVANEGHRVLGWRDVPVDNGDLGYSIVPTEPVIRQIFVANDKKDRDQKGFERDLFIIRRSVELAVNAAKLDAARGFLYPVTVFLHGFVQRSSAVQPAWAVLRRLARY